MIIVVSGAMYNSNLKGVILACVSSAFIGSSFIIKKKGLKRAGVAGPRAGDSLSFVINWSKFYSNPFQHFT